MSSSAFHVLCLKVSLKCNCCYHTSVAYKQGTRWIELKWFTDLNASDKKKLKLIFCSCTVLNEMNHCFSFGPLV